MSRDEDHYRPQLSPALLAKQKARKDANKAFEKLIQDELNEISRQLETLKRRRFEVIQELNKVRSR